MSRCFSNTVTADIIGPSGRKIFSLPNRRRNKHENH